MNASSLLFTSHNTGVGTDEENMHQNKQHLRSKDFSLVAGQTQGNNQPVIQASLKQATRVCQVLYTSFFIPIFVELEVICWFVLRES